MFGSHPNTKVRDGIGAIILELIKTEINTVFGFIGTKEF